MRSSLATAAPLLLVLGTATARSQPPPVVPAARAELVELDAVVTDDRGQVVRDLTESDFQVLEDGKPQKIAQFFLATRARPRPSPTPPPGQAGVVVEAPTVAPTPAPDAALPGRHVVILVDDLHIGLQSMVEAKQALKRLADQAVAPDDEVAVLTTSGAGAIRQLTRDRAT